MTEACTKRLGTFVSELTFEDLPHEVVEKAKALVLDGLANQIVGANEAASQHVAAWVATLGAREEAAVVGHALRAPAALAALCNATMAHAIEMDDAHRDGLVKAGSVLVPSAIAMAEAEDATGKRALLGLVAGYEVMVRLGLALNPGHRRRNFHSTGSLGAFGAAAVGASVLGLDADGATSALGTAGTQAAGLAAFLDDPECMSKAFNAGKGAMNGLMAAQLARQGFIGPRRVLEGEEGFARAVSDEIRFEEMTRGLGTEWRIMEVGYKPHAACRYAHGPIDAAYELFDRHGVDPSRVTGATVLASTLAVRQSGHNDPTTLHAAQGSTPFSVALSLISGKAYLRLKDFSTAWKSENRSVQALCQRIRMDADETRFGFMGRGCEVILTLDDGSTLAAGLDLPKGEPENPLSETELQDKFFALAEPQIGNEASRRVADLSAELDVLPHVGSLMELLVSEAAGTPAKLQTA